MNSIPVAILERIDPFQRYDDFHCERIRSLTVALENEGKWLVYTTTEGGARIEIPLVFDTWTEAGRISDALNWAWSAAPGATPFEVIHFVTGITISP